MNESKAPEVVQIPVEVADEAVVFKLVSRGYHPKEVDARIAALEQELAELRWELDDVATQRRLLAEQRAAQERWVPSFAALGPRIVEIIDLAEQEASEIREAAKQDAAREREGVAAEIAGQREQQTRVQQEQRQAAERELRVLEFTARSRRTMLDTDLAQARRDADISVASQLAQARAQAQNIRDEAARAAAAERAAAQAEVLELHRERDDLAAELVDLSARVAAVVRRLKPPDAAAGTASS